MSPRSRLVGLCSAAAAALSLLLANPAVAVAPPLAEPRIIVHLDLAAGQQPENIALEPDGSADVTFAVSRQVARISPQGAVSILATLPAPAKPATPGLGFAALTGIVRAADGTLFFSYATGTDDLTGIWRLCPGGAPERISALPANSLPNGLALDEHAHRLYSADSALGLVRRIDIDGGAPTVWATGSALQAKGPFGANGIKVHRHAVWVSNTETGTVLRIPILGDGSAGPIDTRYTGLTGIDDFAFTGRGDAMIAALNAPNEVVWVADDGSHSTVLTQQDGLSNPTSVALRDDTVYVPSAAYFTGKDPNLLLAELER